MRFETRTERRGDLPEVGHDAGGLDVGEGAGFAWLVGVADDGDPGQESGEDLGRPRARPRSDGR